MLVLILISLLIMVYIYVKLLEVAIKRDPKTVLTEVIEIMKLSKQKPKPEPRHDGDVKHRK